MTNGLGVLETAEWVVARSRLIAIDRDGVDAVATRLAGQRAVPPAWRVWPHWWDGSALTTNYVLVLDALNFSFWGEPKWRVWYEGKLLDGYWALAACLHRAIRAGEPILDAAYLRQIAVADVARLFDGNGQIPMLDERVANLREVGRGLAECGGTFAPMIEAARGSAVGLIRSVVRCFPSFDDVARYDGRPVQFYKRAQILVSDLYGAFDGRRWGRFGDLDQLTAFADYKLPQLLREDGVLVYAPELAETVDAGREIAAGSRAEVEIRAATIVACERVRRTLNANQGADLPPLRAFEVDWLLWLAAQDRAWAHPYHRTRTIFY